MYMTVAVVQTIPQLCFLALFCLFFRVGFPFFKLADWLLFSYQI